MNEVHSSSNRVAGEVRLRVRYAETQRKIFFIRNGMIASCNLTAPRSWKSSRR